MVNKKRVIKTFLILIVLVLFSFSVGAKVLDAKLIKGSDFSEVLEKTYKDEVSKYFDVADGGNEDGGIGIRVSSSSEMCVSGYSAGPFPPPACVSPFYLCAAFKVGDTFRSISSCEFASPSGGWDFGEKNFTANVDFNNAYYPGQIFVVKSKNAVVDSSDEFFAVDALRDKGWIVGLSPGNGITGLHSYSVDVKTSSSCFVGVTVNDAFSSLGKPVKFDKRGIILLGLSSSDKWDGAYLDSVETSLNFETILSPGKYEGDAFVFVNGILEAKTYLNCSEINSRGLTDEFVELNEGKDFVDYRGDSKSSEDVRKLVSPDAGANIRSELPLVVLSPKTKKVISVKSIVKNISIAFKSFLSIWVPMFVGIFALLIVIYLKFFNNKRAENKSVRVKDLEDLDLIASDPRN